MSDHEQPTRQGEQEPLVGLHPRVWIGSLADYNAGRLHGDWVDAAVPAEELREATQSILARSQEPAAEEWGIFDHDEFAGYRVGEYDDLANVAHIARGIARYGAAFAAWASLIRDERPDLLLPPDASAATDTDDEFSAFTSRYLGSYPTRADWAEEMAHDLAGDIEDAMPQWLQPYVRIAWDALARDCGLGGGVEFAYHADGVWIFNGQIE